MTQENSNTQADDYIGIDYGGGRSNVDLQTGIRHGVVSQHSLNSESLDEIVMNGEDMAFDSAKQDFLEKVTERIHHWFNEHAFVRDGTEDEKRERFKTLIVEALKHECSSSLAKKVADETVESWGFSSERDEIIKDLNAVTDNHFGDYYESDGGLNDYKYEEDGYLLTGCLVSDLFVLRSKYYTYAQFCSPCVPGAGNLDHPIKPGLGRCKVYCLHHDWFDSIEAPYPLWRVEDGVQLLKRQVQEVCPNCNGTGKDSLQRIAEVRKCKVEDIQDKDGFQELDPVTGKFLCYRCAGSGKVTEEVEIEGDIDPFFQSKS